MVCERCKKRYLNTQMGKICDKQGNPHLICVDCYHQLRNQSLESSKKNEECDTKGEVISNPVEQVQNNISPNYQTSSNQKDEVPQETTVSAVQEQTVSDNLCDIKMNATNESPVIKQPQTNAVVFNSVATKKRNIKKPIIILVSVLLVIIAGIITFFVVRENTIGQAEDEVYKACEQIVKNYTGNPMGIVLCGEAKYYGKKEEEGPDERYVKLCIKFFDREDKEIHEVYYYTSTIIPTYYGITAVDENEWTLSAKTVELSASIEEEFSTDNDKKYFIRYIDTKEIAEELGLQYEETNNRDT